MGNFVGFRCSLCGKEYGQIEVEYVCPDHGDRGNLDVVLDHAAIKHVASPETISASLDSSIWRYLPLLPVADPSFERTSLRSVGATPLNSAPRLASRLGLGHLWLKDDSRNPTASFKDRASAVVVARALEIGAKTVVTASTGNAGAALAGMAAAVGLPAVILAPVNAPLPKVAQLLIYGAKVILVEGTYDEAFDLALAASREFGWYCRNTGYNPFTAEGKKTAAFELCEQITNYASRKAPPGRWLAPDRIFVPVGDGNIISGLHKGFQDLLALGWIEHAPKLIGVQAEGSAAIYNAWSAGTETITPVRTATLADSISVSLPRDGVRAVRAVRETGGACLIVTDQEILQAIKTLASDAAIFVEPAAAAAYAGLVNAFQSAQVDPDEEIVVLLTGSGLKDVSAAMNAAGEATRIEPRLEALRETIH